jgi:ferrous iron transport protein A
MYGAINILNSVRTGEVVRVREIKGGRNIRNRLMEMGIIEGAPIRVIANNGGPLMVSVNTGRYAIGQGMAQKISVQRI